MLDEKKIKEAHSNVKNYLVEELMKKIIVIDDKVKNIFVKNCKESLKVAKLLFKENYSDLWTIVCSYYSMYYIANAVLYKLYYKIGDKISHKITFDALIVYVRDKLKNLLVEDYEKLLEDYEEVQNEALEIAGIKTDEIIHSFDLERIKRSRLQYRTTESAKHVKAKTSLERAKRFVFEMEKLL